jgi:hypothetical protein
VISTAVAIGVRGDPSSPTLRENPFSMPITNPNFFRKPERFEGPGCKTAHGE